MPDGFYTFPAIRGIQAGREYYVSMCPLQWIPKMFLFDDKELPAELRAQRVLNKGRLPEIVRYLVKNPKTYSFSALTVSIDAEACFLQLGAEKENKDIGNLRIPMGARLVINDGQHRRAAIVQALKDMPELKDESIAVVFFIDAGLARSQQMFADLNRYSVRPTRSLSILYDHREEWSSIAKALIRNVQVFNGLTEMERSSISNRAVKLFTLSGIFHGTQALLGNHKDSAPQQKVEIATEYWNEVAKHIPDWQMAKEGKATPADLRQNYVHAHALALAALGYAGAALLAQHPKTWKSKLDLLRNVDWSKKNKKLWEGRAMNAGHLQKSRTHILLTTNVLKKALGLDLSGEERVEDKEARKKALERKQHADTRS